MQKLRELSHGERLTIKILRENGLSFPKFGEIVGCHHSTALRIYRSFEATNLIDKLPRNGRPRKFDERDERAVCRTAKRLRFESLRNISRVVEAAYPNKKSLKIASKEDSLQIWHQIFQKKTIAICFFDKQEIPSCLVPK